jgi:ENTS family enterobactin (siderophore) exporter
MRVRRQAPWETAVRRLALGRLISVTGGAAAYTALNFTVWDRTHSPGMQALSLLLTFGVAGILGPFAGALGDRFDRRKVMIWSEALASCFFIGMVFAQAPLLLIVLAFGSAISELPFFSASRAAIPNLVEHEEDIAWANSLVTVGVHAGIAVGPLLGGLIVASGGPTWVFGINAVSFVFSLILTITVRGRFSDPEREASEADGEHQGLTAGIRFLFGEPVLRRMSLAWLVFVLGMGMGMVADAPMAESFGTGATGFGFLIAAWGSGSVLGSAAGRWMTIRSEPLWVVLGSATIAVAAIGVGLAPWFWLVLVCLFVMGTADGLTIVGENGIMQRRTPDAVRSRTMAAFEALLSLGLFVAYLGAIPLLRAVEPQRIYLIGGIAAAAAAIVLVPLLALRREAVEVFELEPEVPVAAAWESRVE